MMWMDAYSLHVFYQMIEVIPGFGCFWIAPEFLE